MGNELITTFRKLIIFSVVAALLGVGLVYGLSYELKPANSAQTLPTTATVESVGDYAGLELTMTLEKTEYSLGEPINITLTITNISNQTISYGYADPNSFFLVYNETENEIYNSLQTQPHQPISVGIPLNAGQSLTDNYAWSQVMNVPVTSEGFPVSPGTYYIVGIGASTGPTKTTPIRVTIDNA